MRVGPLVPLCGLAVLGRSMANPFRVHPIFHASTLPFHRSRASLFFGPAALARVVGARTPLTGQQPKAAAGPPRLSPCAQFLLARQSTPDNELARTTVGFG